MLLFRKNSNMNPKLKAIILEYKEYLNEKKEKAQRESFNLRALNEHLVNPKRMPYTIR